MAQDRLKWLRGSWIHLALIALGVVVGSGFSRGSWSPLSRPVAEEHTYAGSIATKPETLSLIALGDTGQPNTTQRSVARAMSEWAGDNHVGLVLLLGDNFYEDGVRSVDDPQWETSFEIPFELAGLDVPFYAVLGNHDYRGDASAQIAYKGRTHRWTMPSNYYSFTQPVGADQEALFVALDTNTITGDEPEAVQQRDWLRRTLRGSRARWKIAFGHHPLRSGADHGRQRQLVNQVEPIFESEGLDLYLCGHQHYQSVLKGPGKTLHVISGTASEPRQAEWNNQTLWASDEPGFCSIDLTPDAIFLRLVNSRSATLYSHTISAKPSPVALAHASSIAPTLADNH